MSWGKKLLLERKVVLSYADGSEKYVKKNLSSYKNPRERNIYSTITHDSIFFPEMSSEK